MKHTPLRLLTVTTLLTATAYAQDHTPDIDRIFAFATTTTPGCVVGVNQGSQTVVNRAYGTADLERAVPLTIDSVFDIGSLRKQFIAASVLLLAQDGRLKLTDDVRRYLPELPDYGRPVTLDHLLTHTSGIRDWTALLPLTGGNADIPSLILRQRHLNFTPGEEWSYSNSGYVLLVKIVERVSGQTFAAFTHARLFTPLAMTTTSYRSDLRELIPGRALGYTRTSGGWRLDMLLDDDRGDGAILSTARDLLAWNDALTTGKLGTLVTSKLQEPARLNNGRNLTYARGLNVEPFRTGTVVWHSGGAAGYSAWLGRLPEVGLSIAALCNADVVNASALARRVAEVFLPSAELASTTAAPTGDTKNASQPDLADRAGLYLDDHTGEWMRLIVTNGALTVQNGSTLVPLSTDRFRNLRGDLYFRSQEEFELRFTSGGGFTLTSREGRTSRFRRARPFVPSQADLSAIAGRYESDEVGAVEILPLKNGLALRLPLTPTRTLEFTPVDPDTFMAGNITLRLRRDTAGRAVAFDYANPLIRALRFTRSGSPAGRL